ncbi:hypothetical protein BT93_L1885 [Corymbia citriodora subsp. variegata]|uniref:AB hydrolase-1 domain-containing protein n=1 Tax=Corymbia citriodora subsp. variegata TaxID=360336 RepID=A0A8T0CLN0_CORYI|nr:hypothetical protein BT93_L1885 [Corymbia citriodora subsp. variegata]
MLAALSALASQGIRPPPPKTCGSPGGPPITATRVRLRDGRYLAYKEHGVPRELAEHKIVFVHGADSRRHDAVIATVVSPAVLEKLKVYVLSFDKPGYGESDPDPKRTPKSLALDIEDLADQLGLDTKFYVAAGEVAVHKYWPGYGPSHGPSADNAQALETDPARACLTSRLYTKPQKKNTIVTVTTAMELAGAALTAPVINYWWPGFPANMSKEAYYLQPPQDQWALRVFHYAPWLTYWWNTQKWFAASSVVTRTPCILGRQDMEIIPKMMERRNDASRVIVRQQGEAESILRELMVGFGSWEFDPMDIENPFPNEEGVVHLWQGDDDRIVPVLLQRHIAQKLSWIQYHEVPGAGHFFPYADGMGEAILKALIAGQK